MRQEQINVYKFDELDSRAQEKALAYLSELDYAWWQFIFEDASNVGLDISEFDLYRNYIQGRFEVSGYDTANEILKNHGDTCETYKLAVKFMEDWEGLVAHYSDGVKTDEVTDENSYDFDNDADILERDFEKMLLKDYLSLLQQEYEYLTSEECIRENIEANGYEFYEDGSLF